jgi:hypothetical protein
MIMSSVFAAKYKTRTFYGKPPENIDVDEVGQLQIFQRDPSSG